MKQAVLLLLGLCVIAGLSGCGGHQDFSAVRNAAAATDRTPVLKPDYTDITVPPNIGPLNFVIQESGARFFSRVAGKKGEPITVFSKNAEVRFPPGPWCKLLLKNQGDTLSIDVCIRQSDGSWRGFRTIKNAVSSDRTDPYIMYRTLSVLYIYSRDLCLYQRDLETNRESEMLNALNFFPGCCNCHTFYNNDPSRAFFHIRTQDFGNSALVVTGKTVGKIPTKFGYTSWHPNGKLIVYSVNKVDQCFHAAWKDPRDAFDFTSGLKVYRVDKQKIVTVPQIFQESALETWPCWSADGTCLYFSSGLISWTDFKTQPPEHLEQTRYSLMRIPYDEKNDSWGSVDTMLSANVTGKSITQPRVSPDGKFIVFCMHPYGPSPYLQPGSDLYIMDIATRHYEPLAVNSEWSESWHSWSSNSRWLAFTSKRNGGILGRIYLSHIDAGGKAAKPFILPQNDPRFYDSFIKVYNIPEFAIARFTVPQQALVSAIRSYKHLDVDVPVVTGATPRVPPKPE
jgi:hypothetical protein